MTIREEVEDFVNNHTEQFPDVRDSDLANEIAMSVVDGLCDALGFQRGFPIARDIVDVIIHDDDFRAVFGRNELKGSIK